MAGISLAVAQENLDAAIANLAVARKSMSRQVGDRAKGNQRVSDLLLEVEFWQRQVSILSASSSSGGRGRCRNASAAW